MPLADLTAVANLALSHLGEPFLEDYATDLGTTADWVRLHLPQCRETVLEGHVWSFATRCSQLTSAAVQSTTATINVYPGGEDNAILLVANTPGPSGNEISLEISAPDYSTFEPSISVVGTAIVATPPGIPEEIEVTGDLEISSVPIVVPTLIFAGMVNGKPRFTETGIGGTYMIFWNVDTEQWFLQIFENAWASDEDVASPLDVVGAWESTHVSGTGNPSFSGTVLNTAAEVIAAINADASSSLLVEAFNADGHDGTGAVVATDATFLAGGAATSTVFAPAYGSAFNLPADCLRVLKIDETDIDVPRNRFEIQGRYLLLEETLAEAPVVHYIAAEPPVDEWPTTFTDAVAYLLAARLARLLTQDRGVIQECEALHEKALGKARSKDTRETRSKENFGPRQLAARSGFVRARYNNSTLPPY